jgi:ribokinase
VLDPEAVECWLGADELPEDTVCLLNLEIPDPPLVTAARCAAARGARRIVVNPAPARALPAALLELGPILTPNAGELDELTAGSEHAPADSALQLSARSRAPVVVTLGAQGAILASGEGTTEVSAPASEAVDTTGAGDAFNGALAAALAQGYALPAAVRRAVVAGSCSVTARGARSGMPARAETIVRRPTGGTDSPSASPAR